jgi:hypothetical protein
MTTRYNPCSCRAAFAVCFAGVLGVLAAAWVTNEVYSCGLAVLLIIY